VRRTGWLSLLLTLVLAGCYGSGLIPDPTDDDDATDDDDLAPDDDDTVPTFDCTTAPTEPDGDRVMPGARGYHGLAIDAEGRILGSDLSALIRSTYQGDWDVFLPSSAAYEQMVFLPGGDLVISSANTGDLQRVTPDGGTSVIASGLWAYGVVLGPDGLVWTAGNYQLSRVNPTTGDVSPVTSWFHDDEPHSLGFSPAGDRLYVGTISAGWESPLYVVELGAEFEALGPPEVLAADVGGGWQDGIAVDICGTLYVPDYWSSALHRVEPDGSHEVFLDWSDDESMYGHGVIWGTGVGGWRQDAVYLPMPYGGMRVQEVIIGVPSSRWEGEAIGAR